MSYLNPHTLDGDTAATTEPDTVGTLLPKLAALAHRDVLAEVAVERARQDAKWGEQNHPDGTGPDGMLFGINFASLADMMRKACQQAARDRTVTWAHIAGEEAAEALAEDDPAKLRAELVQVAAVAVAWIEAIDRRTRGGAR